MSKPKVIVTRRWPEAVETRLAEVFDVQLNESDRPLSQDQLRAAFAEADAVFPTVSDRIDAEVLGAGVLGAGVLGAEPLTAKLCGNFGVGFNNIDIEAAKARGIAVTNTPGVLTDATADLAMTLLLAVARRAGEGERHLRNGAWTGWRPTHMMGTQVTGKTLGLIGFGRIGRALAERAHFGFHMDILFHDPYPPSAADAKALGATAHRSIEAVLEGSDFVSLHTPGGADTRHLMNAERFARMKAGAYLINTSRGDVIDEAALVQVLKSGAIAGARLDVFEGEPKVTPALVAMENVVLLPHLGSATLETRVAMGMTVLKNAEAFFAGETPPNRVA
jgi:lactate dehydrogenase-like 2-hydroxyacid dehydrogenase